MKFLPRESSGSCGFLPPRDEEYFQFLAIFGVCSLPVGLPVLDIFHPNI